MEILWQPQPYYEKLLIDVSHITLRGIAGPEGELPVIDGNGAVQTQSISGNVRISQVFFFSFVA